MLSEELWDCDVLAQIQQEKKVGQAYHPTLFCTRDRNNNNYNKIGFKKIKEME